MPDPKNQLNETISHLAERVSGIAVTLHLFEERMKSLTSSLGRVSALLLLQAGIPIGGVGSLFNAARFLGGTTNPNKGNKTDFILSQIEKGIPYNGGKNQGQGGSGINLEFLSEVGLAALTGSAKKEVQETSGLLTEMMQIFKKQIRDLISSEMGPGGGGRGKFTPTDPLIVTDTEAAWKASGPNPVAVDLEWAYGPNKEKSYLQAGFAKSGKVGQRFNLNPDPDIPLDEEAKKAYLRTVSISEGDFNDQMNWQGTTSPLDYFKALAEELQTGASALASNPAAFKQFFQSQKLWTYSGFGDAEGMNQLWKKAYDGAGADSLSPFTYGDKDSNVLDVRDLPGVQKKLKQLAKQGKSLSLQEVFKSVYGKDADRVMLEQEQAHGSLGHRNDSNDPTRRKHHIPDLDSATALLTASRSQNWYEDEQAKLREREANKEVKQEKQEVKATKLLPHQEKHLKHLEGLAAADYVSNTQLNRFGQLVAVTTPISPEEKAKRQKDVEEYKQQLAKLTPSGNQPRSLSDLLAVGNGLPVTPTPKEEESLVRQRRRSLKNFTNSALGGPTLSKNPPKSLSDFVENLAPVEIVPGKRPVQKQTLVSKTLQGLSNVTGPMRAFSIALAQATGMLGMLAKAGAPDAFETLKGVIHIIAAQLGSMLVPAIVEVTQKFISLAEGLESFRHNKYGKFAEDTITGYASSGGNGWWGVAKGVVGAMGWDVDGREKRAQQKWNAAIGTIFNSSADNYSGGAVKTIRDTLSFNTGSSSSGQSAFGLELKKAISLVSVKTTPQYSSLEDTYKKVQLDVLGKGPIEKILERIQEESLLQMLKRLESMDGKMSGSPTRPFGSI